MNVLVAYKGFSLIELLIILSIISLLLAFVVPSYKETMLHAEDARLSSQLLRAIRLTQMEAVMRQELVTLRFQHDGYSITTNEKILHQFSNPKHAGQLHWRAFPVHRDNLQFLKTGMTHAENGTFWYCHDAKPRWAMVINQAGRTRVVYPGKDVVMPSCPS